MRQCAMGRTVWMAAIVTAAGLAPAEALHAQEWDDPRGHFGLSFVAGNPIGDLDAFFDQGFGAQLEGSWAMTEDRRVRVRVRGDLGFLIYGHERIRYCYSVPIGCRVEADLTTTNNIFYFGIGPEVAFSAGDLEPYLCGTTGLSHFATISSLGGADGGPDWARTTNYDDVVLAWRVGGGMRLRVSRGHRPVFLDFGIERHQNGIAEFLTDGDIVDNPDGSVTLFPHRSEANLVTFRLGAMIGLGRRRID